MNLFKPQNDSQVSLLEDIKTLRSIKGSTSRFTILRSVAKTRKHTRTIYPDGWRFE
ncbi:MAG: hypothetical protein V9G42_05235 [Bacteroidia bacterium]